MKKLIFAILIMTIALTANAKLLDKIVAKIGSDIILRSELEQQIEQLRASGADESLLIPAVILKQMVEQRLLVQKARDLKIKIDEAAIKEYAKNYVAQIKSQFPSEAAFQAELAQMKLTQTELQKRFEDQIKESALTEQLMEREIISKIRITDYEMREFYEASKDSMAVKPVSWELRMIMREVLPSEDAAENVLSEVEDIRRRLQNGADFAELAAEHSDCPSSQQGGDLGFFSRGMMVRPFEDAAYTLSVGEISEVVKSQFGYHIIKVTEKKGDEVRASHILKTISSTETDEEREMALLNEIRDQILAGADFAELAREYSMDPASAEDGGLLGEFTEQDIPPLFSAPILNTAVGQVTEVLKHEGMIYLFIRDIELPSRIYTFDEVKEQVEGYLTNVKQIEAYEEWIEELKRDAYIQISL